MTIVEDYYEERLAYKRSRTIRANISIKHWQLKNLLCCGSSPRPNQRDQLLFVSRHSVRTLDFEHASIGLAGPKFSFEPRSLTSRYGWIAAGAEHGILAILDGRGEASSLQEGPRKQEVVIGGCLVNGIHIHHNAAGEDVALVSSNDHSLKCYNLSRGYLESPISMPTAMNHASVTPDGKWMVAVGDNTVCYLFAQESGSWVRQGTLSVATDACFATGFSASGRMLAVGSQDGTCSIFDMRMISVTKYPFLHRCHTTRPFPHGSVRALAFSPSPLDLLVFTESTSHATLVDCRDFSAPQQRLSVPLADSVRDRHHGDSHYGVDGRDREISGVCWSRTGSHVYVGSDETVTDWTINATERRCFPTMNPR